VSSVSRPSRSSSPATPPDTPVLILPGYGGSGPGHWQTLWERDDARFTRVEARDWEHPARAEWVENLEGAVRAAGPGTVLVAHSLACLQVAHWAAATSLTARAALLVAPPDPAEPVFPATATGFAPVPMTPLPFPSLVVGSTDDPYASLDFTQACARAWGSRFASIGAAGHINAASGLGAWREGRELLGELLGIRN
jgi:predicted alpha/beta hydrolase family esterase